MRKIICNIHDNIYKTADKAISNIPKHFKYSDMNEEELYEMCSNMENIIDDLKYILMDIKDLAEDAKECGQSMEDRLKDYRDAIEGLGFIREE